MNSFLRSNLGHLLAATILGASAARSEVAIEFHCVGGSQLASDTHLTPLHEVLAAPQTTDIENIALAKFSGLLSECLRHGNGLSPSTLLEPLLSDAVAAESLGSMGGGPGSSNAPSFILAVRLEASRAQLWHDNLAKYFGNGGEKFDRQGFGGWRWNAEGSNALWIIPAQDWLVVGRGDEFSTLQAEYLDKIKAEGRPGPALKTHWLEAELASDRLGGWFRFLKPAHIRISVSPGDRGELQINAQVVEKEAAFWKSEPWIIPKSLMRSHTISFTAGQDVATFLNVEPAYSNLPGYPLSGQFYLWALDQMPLLNYAAWPETDASNLLQQLSTDGPSALNPFLKRFDGMELVWQAAARKLICMNINFFAPVLEVEHGEDGQFLFLSTFPLSQSEPAPESLLAQIQGRTNLVYYDWEITGHRVREWQILSKMIDNRASRPDRGSVEKAAAETAWLGALTRLPGETVTEITRVAPNELSVERKAPVGFTAAELVFLADWLCGANSGPIFPPPPRGKPVPRPRPPAPAHR